MTRRIAGIFLALAIGAFAYEESNESSAVLAEAQAKVQAKLDEFARSNRHELLEEARKLSWSLNPRQREGELGAIDEGSLRLQLKVLLAIAAARDPHYNPEAPGNIPMLNVAPPLGDGPAGVDPRAIKDPVGRKAYEDAIADNHRRAAKSHRELQLSRGVDYAVIYIWRFVRALAEGSPARRRAFEIIRESVGDPSIRQRLLSDARPGLTR